MISGSWVRAPHPAPCSVENLLLPLPLFIDVSGGTGAQSVTQPDAHITVSEESPLELRCSHSSSLQPYLYWYVQNPNQGLQLLLLYISGDTLVKGIIGFEAEFRKTKTSFHLRKPSAHGSNTAKYFCAVNDTESGTAGRDEHKLLENVRLQVTQRDQPGAFSIRSHVLLRQEGRGD
uniref:Ig-like domain-containing protein n=1 Tax=Neovison vison TaxID=452646 RepID=A0A8C7BVL8_NEOVI